jgi:hypothetical protein
MSRPLLSLDRLSLDERIGRVAYRLTSLLAEIYTLSGWIKGQGTSKRFTPAGSAKKQTLMSFSPRLEVGSRIVSQPG